MAFMTSGKFRDCYAVLPYGLAGYAEELVYLNNATLDYFHVFFNYPGEYDVFFTKFATQIIFSNSVGQALNYILKPFFRARFEKIYQALCIARSGPFASRLYFCGRQTTIRQPGLNSVSFITVNNVL